MILISVPTGGSILIKIKGQAGMFLFLYVSVTPANFFKKIASSPPLTPPRHTHTHTHTLLVQKKEETAE